MPKRYRTIAIDSTSFGNTTSGSSQTVAHTCSGTDRILMVAVFVQNVTVTGVTYAGVAMTQINTRDMGGPDIYLFRLVKPTLGNNNIVVSASGTGFIFVSAASYTGVDQTNPINANNTGSTSGATLTISATSTLDGCWYVMGVRDQDDGSTDAGTNTYERVVNNGYIQLFDTNGSESAGSNSLVATNCNNPTAGCLAVLAPAEIKPMISGFML